MLTVCPSIHPAITALAPGFRALSIVVEAAPLRHAEVGAEALKAACEGISADSPRGLRRISPHGARCSKPLAPNPSAHPVQQKRYANACCATARCRLSIRW